MSEQHGERKTWYVGDVVWGTATMVYEGSDDPHKGKFVCDCESIMFCEGDDDEDGIVHAGDGNPQHTAQQIAEEHNRIPELEASVVDMRDRVILERERRESAWAEVARLRQALASGRQREEAMAKTLASIGEFDLYPACRRQAQEAHSAWDVAQAKAALSPTAQEEVGHE
jgi:hypothetical protein